MPETDTNTNTNVISNETIVRTPSGINVTLLLKVKKHILAKPTRLHMGNWFEKAFDIDRLLRNTVKIKGRKYIRFLDTTYGEPPAQILPECGAVGCIRGWATVCHFGIENYSFFNMQKIDDILGMSTYYYSKDLFFVSRWPSYFEAKYRNAKNQRERAIIVGRVIDLFIKCDGNFHLAQPSDFTEVTRRKKSKSPASLTENLTPSPDTL